MSQRYNDNKKKAKAERKSAKVLKNLRILPESSVEELGSRREHCWGYTSIYENSPKKLLQLSLVVQ